METFIQALPKIELHLHIEDSLEPELMFELAQRKQVDIPFGSAAETRAAYEFSDLQSFLDIYYQGANVLIKEQDFFDLCWAYLLRCQQDKVLHPEIFFDPQTHTGRGIPFGVIVNGLHRALEQARSELGISSHLIMCFLRHLDEDSAFATLRQAEARRDKIIGVGLDSAEVGNPSQKFQHVFDTIQQHHIVDLLRQGHCVTVNSDDPAYFGGYMTDNFIALASAIPMSRDEIARFSFNAIEASFASTGRKQPLETRLHEYLNTGPARIQTGAINHL